MGYPVRPDQILHSAPFLAVCWTICNELVRCENGILRIMHIQLQTNSTKKSFQTIPRFYQLFPISCPIYTENFVAVLAIFLTNIYMDKYMHRWRRYWIENILLCVAVVRQGYDKCERGFTYLKIYVSSSKVRLCFHQKTCSYMLHFVVVSMRYTYTLVGLSGNRHKTAQHFAKYQTGTLW